MATLFPFLAALLASASAMSKEGCFTQYYANKGFLKPVHKDCYSISAGSGSIEEQCAWREATLRCDLKLFGEECGADIMKSYLQDARDSVHMKMYRRENWKACQHLIDFVDQNERYPWRFLTKSASNNINADRLIFFLTLAGSVTTAFLFY